MSQESKPTVDGLIEFYKSVLGSMGLAADDNGLLSVTLGGVNVPCVVTEMGGRRLVLPTRDIQREADWKNKVAFHPLTENVYRGESPVLKKMKNAIIFRLNVTASYLLHELMAIAANKSYHEKLSPKQSELLDVLPRVTSNTVNSVEDVTDKYSLKGREKLINVYLKHGGKYKGNDFSRVGVVSFPILEMCDQDSATIFGVKMKSKRDFKAFFDLFHYILPKCDESEAYNYGSQSMEAPYFDALLHTYLKVAKQLNKITRLFKRHLSNPEENMIDVSWEGQLSDLSFYRGLIPVLEGNDGELSIDEKEKAKMASEQPTEAVEEPAKSSIFQQPPQPAQPQFQPQPQPQFQQATQPAPPPQESESGKLSWQEIMKARSQPQQQPQFQQPMQQQFQQQQPPQPPPGWAGARVQPQQPQQPAMGYRGQTQQQPQQFPQQVQPQQQPPWNNNVGGVVYRDGI